MQIKFDLTKIFFVISTTMPRTAIVTHTTSCNCDPQNNKLCSEVSNFIEESLINHMTRFNSIVKEIENNIYPTQPIGSIMHTRDILRYLIEKYNKVSCNNNIKKSKYLEKINTVGKILLQFDNQFQTTSLYLLFQTI